MSVVKPKYQSNHKGQSQMTDGENPTMQSKLKANECSWREKWKICSESELALVLFLIGQENGASFLTNNLNVQ